MFHEDVVKEDYLIRFDILWQTCEQETSYNSFYLWGECTIDSSLITLESKNKVKVEVYFDDNIIFEDIYPLNIEWLDTTFSWSSWESSVEYNQTSWDLRLVASIQHDIWEFFDGYKFKLGKVKNGLYLKDFSDGTRVLKSGNYFDKDFQWYLTYSEGKLWFDILSGNSWEVEDEQFYVIEVYDEGNERIAYEDITMTIRTTADEDDINWKIVEGDSYLDEEAKLLYVKAYLKDIETLPTDEYFLFLWINQSYKFSFDESKNELSSMYSIRYEKWRDDRSKTISYSIKDSNHQTIDDWRFKIYVDYKKTSFDEFEKQSVQEITKPSKLELAVDKLILKQQQKYVNTQDLKDNLIVTIQVLNIYAEKKPEYKSIISELNNIIQTRVDDM